MKDIPQPSSEPYSVKDKVQIYLSKKDVDNQHHGKTCEITEVLKDDLNSETGRELDAYSYKLQDIETGEKLSVTFRHFDLVPVE